jgi:hypothetical protein
VAIVSRILVATENFKWRRYGPELCELTQLQATDRLCASQLERNHMTIIQHSYTIHCWYNMKVSRSDPILLKYTATSPVTRHTPTVDEPPPPLCIPQLPWCTSSTDTNHVLLTLNWTTPSSYSANELYRPSDRRMSAKLVPTFADGGCRVVSETDPHGRILGFLDRSRYYFLQVAPELYSRDPPLLTKSGSAGNRTRDLWICGQELWPIDHRGGRTEQHSTLFINYCYLYFVKYTAYEYSYTIYR